MWFQKTKSPKPEIAAADMASAPLEAAELHDAKSMAPETQHEPRDGRDDVILPRVTFTEKAYRDFIAHARGWLEAEICGVLVGETSSNADENVVHVQAVIRGEAARQKRIQVTFTQETWNAIHDAWEKDYPHLQIVGWYHTHPGFGVEFSDLDIFVQKNFFPLPTQIALVTDPLSGEIAICVNTAASIATLDQFWVNDREVRCHKPVAAKIAIQDREVEAKLDEILPQLKERQTQLPPILTGAGAENFSAAKKNDFMIAPPAQRIFPPIGPELYNSAAVSEFTPDQVAARKILALSEQDFNFRQRYRGRDLEAPGEIGRLLLLHKMAVAAELEAQWERADFFWREAHAKLETLFKKNLIWDKLAAEAAKISGATRLTNPDELRQRFVEEIFIDAHVVFYNNRVQQAEALKLTDRAFAHFNYLRKLPAFSSSAESRVQAMLGPPAIARLVLLQKKKKWKTASRFGLSLLRQCPDDIKLRNKLAELYFAKTLATLHDGESRKKNRRDAKALREGIKPLTALREEDSGNATVNRLLGDLHHRRAVKLANVGGFAEALVEAQKAFVLFEVVAETLPPNGLQAESNEKIPAAGEDEAVQIAEVNVTHDETVAEKVETAPPAPTPVRATRRRGFPFLFWLFSRQDRFVKVQAAVAVVLLLLAAVMSGRDFQIRQTRNAAYQKLVAAAEEHDYQNALHEAEIFLARSPLNKKDVREPKVKKLYEEAFVRWFMQQEDDLPAEALAQVERFNKLTFKFRK